VAIIYYLDLAGSRMTRPHERTTVAGLVPAAELGGVVRDCRPEIGPPGTLTVVAVRTWIGQDVDSCITYLDGQGVRVGMRGDAEVSVRAAVTAAPDHVLPAGAQERHSPFGEPRRPLAGPALDIASGACQGADHDTARTGRRPRPPVEGPDQSAGQDQQRGPGVRRWWVEQQRLTL